jgi:hypothetical protein
MKLSYLYTEANKVSDLKHGVLSQKAQLFYIHGSTG